MALLGCRQGGVAIVVERQLQRMAALVVSATLAALTWSVTGGVAVAGAGAGASTSTSTRLRSGSLHAQLVSHVSSGANALSPSAALEGSDVMAAIVATLAVLAVVFLIVTFIRRRITTA